MTTGFNLEAALQRRRRGSPSSVGKIEPAIVGKDWKKHKKLDTRLLPVHRYTEAAIAYNPKHYQKDFQTEAMRWWSGTLSINEMKAFEKKHGIIYDRAMPSEIAAIYDAEIVKPRVAEFEKSHKPFENIDIAAANQIVSEMRPVDTRRTRLASSAGYKPGDPVDVRQITMSGGVNNPNTYNWVRGYKFVRRDSPGVPFTGTALPNNPDLARDRTQGHIIVSGPVVGGEGEVRYDENDVRPAQLRAVKVWFSDGNHLVTNMAKGITDKEIRDYYAVGRTFNVGQDPDGQEDNLVKVTRIEILD